MSVIAESVSSSVSNLDKALEIVSEMTFAEKLAFNVKFSALLAKEAKGAGAIAKAAKKEAKAKKDPDAPKRPQTAGQMAWKAFVKHCKETMSERFTDCVKEPDRLAVCKAIRSEDTSAYDAFVEDFKAKVESGEIVAKVAEPKAKKVSPKKSKKASESDDEEKSDDEDTSKKSKKPKKASESDKPKKSKKASESDDEDTSKKPKKASESDDEDKSKKPSAAAAAAGGGGKSAKDKLKATTQKRKEKEEKKGFEKIELLGEKLWLHKETNGLYGRSASDGFDKWMGYYQPDNEEEPVRFTDAPDVETA